ncbi:MAG TPA: EamA family transporter [Spirochaetota bacterium]|nr:EamA family transporter [Spirochaetota bacterium]
MGLIFALLNPLFNASRSLTIKKGGIRLKPVITAWGSSVTAIILLSPLLFFINYHKLNTVFFTNGLIAAVINSTTVLLTIKAIQKGELSLVEPLRSMSPLFLLFTAPLLLGEYTSAAGITGVLLIVTGSYFLEIKNIRQGITAPLRALWHNPGARLMLLNTVLWSISTCFAKKAILAGSPLAFTFLFQLTIFFIYLPFIIIKKISLTDLKKEKGMRIIVLIGFFMALANVSQNVAISLIPAVYVIALKRLDLLFNILFGKFFFREKKFAQRLTAGLIMLTGSVIVALY